ncbi:MAG: 5-methyltetrahydropteroyltriglutamate--homocysteine S-methyltransferase, partial [Gemmatimonadales bacterium]
MTIASNLGFPPLGAARELKRATEGYWSGKTSRSSLLATGTELRRRHWELQRDAGLERIPSNDFSLYDRMLDACTLVGAVPARYGAGNADGRVDLDTYFAMARGSQGRGRDVTAMEMTKWLDTNYHYIVPELEADQTFRTGSTKPLDEYREAKALGIDTVPVLIGPLTFLLLAKTKATRETFDRLRLLDGLLPVYAGVLSSLAAAGATWVQLDEPCLALDRTDAERAAYGRAYEFLAARSGNLRLMVATYFAGLGDNAKTVLGLPVHGLHVDLVRAPDQLEALLAAWPGDRVFSAGVIDGRNVWRADLDGRLTMLERIAAAVGKDRLWVAPSCSLLHTPLDLDLETQLDAELKSWLAFGKQKLGEVVALARAVDGGKRAAAAAFEASARAAQSRRASTRTNDPAVKRRAAAVGEQDLARSAPYAARRTAQVDLPAFPTTTIGSFPQTADVRAARRKLHTGQMSAAEYDAFIEAQITKTIALQAEIGLDVLVHGEFERNDMVEYFGEQLAGFAFTEHGWVQSYGTRYVKPPIIFGDVSRPR